MSKKAREGKHQHLAHHALIKLILMDDFIFLRIPVLCTKFVDMSRDIFIETEAIPPMETPAFSIGGKEGKTKEEEGEKKRGGRGNKNRRI